MGIFLETNRLIIRIPELADFDSMYALQSDAEVMQYVGTGVRTQAEVRLGLEKAIAHQEKHGFSLGSVYEKNGGDFVGRAGLIYLGFNDTQKDVEVAYALTKATWGKGYATELANALIEWGFQHLEVERLIAVTNPNNQRSRRVLEKAKMTYAGLISHSGSEAALYTIMRP